MQCRSALEQFQGLDVDPQLAAAEGALEALEELKDKQTEEAETAVEELTAVTRIDGALALRERYQ